MNGGMSGLSPEMGNMGPNVGGYGGGIIYFN